MRPPKAMQRVFICSPYRAATKEDLARNIAYAKELTEREKAVREKERELNIQP